MAQSSQAAEKPFYDSYNLTPLGPDAVYRILDSSFDKNIVFCLVGEAGIGKTEISEQIAKKRGMGHIAVYVSLCQTEDLAGIPRDTGRGTYTYLAPDRIVQAIKDSPNGGILALEEINRMVDSSVGGAIFAIISERRIGDFRLPDNWVVMATMNPHSGAYAVTDISRDHAWIRRLCMLAMVHNSKDWLAWAKSANIHKSVISYIISNPEHLLDEATRSTNTAYANPAGWAKVSRMMYHWDERNTPESVKRQVITGLLGKAVTTSFLSFVNKEVVCIPPEDIVNNFSDTKSEVHLTTLRLIEEGKREVVAKSALSLATYLITDKPDMKKEHFTNIVRFAKVLDEDSQVAFFNEMINAVSRAGNTPEQKQWYQKFNVGIAQHPDFASIAKHLQQINAEIANAWKDNNK